MIQLPDHLPILRLEEGNNANQKTLGGHLQKRLEARKIGVGYFRPPDTEDEHIFTPRMIKALMDCDLLLIEKSQATSICPAGTLSFGAQASLSSETPQQNQFFCRQQSDVQECSDSIASWLENCWEKTPVMGAILIGGRSSRMGYPKHLIKAGDGRSWLEHMTAVLSPFVSEVILSGRGDIPQSLTHLKRVADLAGVEGPMTGLAAVMRDQPFASWLILACDMPQISQQAIRWLLGQRQVKSLAVLPKNLESGRIEPLFSWYDYRCRPLVDSYLDKGGRKISELWKNRLVSTPIIPDHLSGCWRNVNRPEEL